MSLVIRPAPADDEPLTAVVADDDAVLTHIRFDLVRPCRGQRLGLRTDACEHVGVILSGTLALHSETHSWPELGERAGVFDGPATTFYQPIESEYWLEAVSDRAEVALLRFPASKRFEPFVVRPDEVESVSVGESPCRRDLEFAVGPGCEGRVDRAVVLEVFTQRGNWAGTPPHKHDEQRPPEETAVDELYHFRFDPAQGFGVQCLYRDAADRTASIVRDGDTALLPAGYHPVGVLPGYSMYYLVAMAGEHGRDVIQSFEPEHAWQLGEAKGVDAMRSSFASTTS